MSLTEKPKALIYVRAASKEEGLRAVEHFFSEGDSVTLSAAYRSLVMYRIYYLKVSGFSSKAKTIVEILIPVKTEKTVIQKPATFPQTAAETMLQYLKGKGLKVKFVEEINPI